ncbi:MAG: type II toxin-antitoxin system RelE/ParE family toxin [Desulfobacca sp.]|nr:type II toxin-antitoxin system RelE/ParE family toxin [Desulfobacca sp.]
MSYRVEVRHQAAKEFKRLDRTTLKRLEAKINQLADNPYNPRISRQMETDPEVRYSRVGNWRIIYVVNETAGTLDIVSIRPRSSAYR